LENCLAVRALLSRGALCSELIECTLGYIYHRAIRCLLLDRDHDFSIALFPSFRDHLRASLVLFLDFRRRMRWSVQICFSFRLVLHLELGEKCLLEFSLLGRADRLARYLLPFVELVEHYLLLLVLLPTHPLLVVVCAIRALMLQVRVERRTVFVELLPRASISTVLTLPGVMASLA